MGQRRGFIDSEYARSPNSTTRTPELDNEDARTRQRGRPDSTTRTPGLDNEDARTRQPERGGQHGNRPCNGLRSQVRVTIRSDPSTYPTRFAGAVSARVRFLTRRRCMNENSKTRFVLIGGFLGAGKTTLIGELARRYMAAGKRVGIITNDQADDLVDTLNLRSQGFDVGEVAGACFCCSFDDLVSTAETLSTQRPPDVLLAEPVGSCTDLVATVILPLQQLLGERFELAPFGVLLKPSHGRRILDGESSSARSGFSAQAEYIFRKQLEEADYLMIGRLDQLNDQEVSSLKEKLESLNEGVPVIAISPRRGDGVEGVMGYIESPMIAGRRLLQIDYDTYADGEADLGWVNLTAMLRADEPVELDTLAHDIVASVAERIAARNEGQIAHLKVSVLGGDAQAVASVVSNDTGVDIGLAANRSVSGRIQMIVNARVSIDPQVLEEICRQRVSGLAESRRLEVESISAHSLRPGRPTPTHRVTQA